MSVQRGHVYTAVLAAASLASALVLPGAAPSADPAYALLGAGLIIGVLSLSVLANSAGVVAGNGLWAMERPKANFVADLCSLGVVIATALFFIPALGPLGAAIATLAGTATDAAVRLWILRRAMQELSMQGGRT